jgi:hypothetical protein
VRTWIRDQSLSLFFLGLFLLTLFGQSIAGWKGHNEQQLAHDSPTISYPRYLVSSDYGQAVMENWQSEYLQFVTFIMATIWFVQRGSNESKQIRDIGRESDEKQKVGRHAKDNSPRWAKTGGWRTSLYSNSLLLVMLTIFFGTWFAQSVTGVNDYNADQRDHDQPTVSWGTYLTRPNFWENTLQNWQSEFLAVGTMAAYTVYLRQRGSPESKPVGAPHDETGSSG